MQYKRISNDLSDNSELEKQIYHDYMLAKHNPSAEEVETMWVESLKKLRWAMEQLTPRQRTIFQMVALKSKKETQTDIAKKLGLSQSTVSRNYKDAVNILKNLFAK